MEENTDKPWRIIKKICPNMRGVTDHDASMKRESWNFNHKIVLLDMRLVSILTVRHTCKQIHK